MEKVKLWLVRDKDGVLVLFVKSKPFKEGDAWAADFHVEKYGDIGDAMIISTDASVFPNVKWEDDEPTEVKLEMLK